MRRSLDTLYDAAAVLAAFFLIGVLVMVTFIPSLALWLPDLLMGK